jgi:hypothetical protein
VKPIHRAPRSILGCGMNVVRAVADVYQRVPMDKRGIVEKLTGLTTPRSLLNMLTGMGLDARILTGYRARVSLGRDLKRGPQILLVGVGPLRLIPHWVLVWERVVNTYATYDSWPFHDLREGMELGNSLMSAVRVEYHWQGGRFRGARTLRISITRPR